MLSKGAVSHSRIFEAQHPSLVSKGLHILNSSSDRGFHTGFPPTGLPRKTTQEPLLGHQDPLLETEHPAPAGPRDPSLGTMSCHPGPAREGAEGQDRTLGVAQWLGPGQRVQPGRKWLFFGSDF